MRWCAVLLCAAALTGCRKNNCPGGPGCEPTESDHTFIMYCVGENNLWSFLRGNVNMALSAVEKGLPSGSRVLVYWDGQLEYRGDAVTRLTELVVRNGKAEEKIIKEYPQQMSTDPAVMQSVIRDAVEYAPAEVYGIAMLGHGTGWFPPELNNLLKPVSGEEAQVPEHDLHWRVGSLTRAFGPDNGVYMSPEDMAEGLSTVDWNYIILDDCFMASVELLYELRGKAPYAIASSAEVMGAGIPYHEVLPAMFDRRWPIRRRVSTAVDRIVDYYEKSTVKSAAFAAVDLRYMDELADRTRDLFAAGVGAPDIEAIQHLELLSLHHAFFDLRDYLGNIAAGNGAEALLGDFDVSLGRAVFYERHTAQIYSSLGNFGGGYFDADRICGLSSYIPREELPVTRDAYYSTSWAKYTQPHK